MKNKFIEEVNRRMVELERNSSRKCTETIRTAQSYHEGYVQGISDIMSQVEELALNESKYKEQHNE